MVMPLSPRYFDDGAKRPFPLNSIIFDTPTQSNDVPDYSPPDLLQDDDEDDEESLSTPYSLSPRQQPNSYFINHRAECRRRKPVPHRSPALTNDAFKASLLDKSVVFQLDVHSQAPFSHSTNDACSDCSESNNPCDLKCTSKVICGQSLLSALRKRIVDARSFQRPVRQIIHSRKRARAASFIEIPKPPTRYRHTSSEPLLVQPDFIKDWTLPKPIVPAVQEKKIVARYTSSYATSGRPSRIKGPCQACQEASDGCMRKAFNWPFPASQVFNDKGKPFVYLCNKCGLRYSKSGGCVCRNCRWVFCKEEKRKALQHIELMRQNCNGGEIDPNQDIEHFVCSPKYWSCGRPWKVGWVLNNLDEEEEDGCNGTVSSQAST